MIDPSQSQSVKIIADLPPGAAGQIHALTGEHDFCSRMANLGFTEGALVTMRQNYGRGPIVVSVRGALVALGRAEAGRILVYAREAS